MADPTECFNLDEELGSGSFGAVYAATCKSAIAGLRKRQTCAVKIVQLESDMSMEEYRSEVSLMKQLKHEHIVELHGAWIISAQNELWIAMERAEYSVLDVMRVMRRGFPEPCIASIVKQTAQALVYLHAKKIVHRDLKGANILLNSAGAARLCDFGVSAVIGGDNKRETVVGSPYWMAPEVIKEVGYATPADIWGLAITCIEMAEMNPPHSEIHPMRVLFLVPGNPPPTLREPSAWSPAFSQFLKACLRKKPAERPNAKVLLASPWLKKVPKNSSKKVAKFCSKASAAIKRCGSLATAIDEADGESELQTEEDLVEALKNMTFSSSTSEVDLSAYLSNPDSAATMVTRATIQRAPAHLGTVQLRRTKDGTVRAKAVDEKTEGKMKKKKRRKAKKGAASGGSGRRDSAELPPDVQSMHSKLRAVGLEIKGFCKEMRALTKTREDAMIVLQEYTRNLQELSLEPAWKHPSCRRYIGRIEKSREKATLMMLKIDDDAVMAQRVSGASSPPTVARKKRSSKRKSVGGARRSSGSPSRSSGSPDRSSGALSRSSGSIKRSPKPKSKANPPSAALVCRKCQWKVPSGLDVGKIKFCAQCAAPL